jgi:gamma-glutamyltranspeptidase/glutathione hydrolase
MARGVVAAGHPVTAEAGARVLREGGNAVDAAVGAVLASFVAESPLTGLGAGGYMLVYEPGSEPELLDFFVEVPGRAGSARRSELVPIPVYFSPDTPQVFNVGAASCGVPGTPAGLELAGERFGSVPIAELARPAAALARDGIEVNARQAFFLEILKPILTSTEEARRVYAPGGDYLREGDVFRLPELADALDRYAADGAEPFYRGEVAKAICDWVGDRGGTLGTDDLAAYEPQPRDPVRARFRGREILCNPPPSSGGILIGLCLELLGRLGDVGIETVVAVMQAAQEERTEDFLEGLDDPDFAAGFLAAPRLDALAAAIAESGPRDASPPGDLLGSTTHITVADGDGRCASVTCSNGTGSGIIVPGTGVHVNNMLGEEDLNPLGFHRFAPGRRMPSMMSPTVIVREGEVEAGLGSGGSNRIRSAVLQTILHLTADGMSVRDAVVAPRVHFEAGIVQAEPGIDETGLRRLEGRGLGVARWQEPNLFFGGVHTVARDPQTGDLTGAGDPRRGGAVAVA